MNVDARAALIDRLGRCQHEITIAYLNRQLFEGVRDEIVARRPESDGTWLNSYQAMYGQTQAMAIRRFADSHKDKPDSIWWIVERIRRTPALASRRALIDAVVAQRTGDAGELLLERVHRSYDRLAGSGELPSAEALSELQHRLKASAKAVVAYADRRIAHLDPRGERQSVTFNELHQALDEVAAIANDVSVMLTSSHTSFELVTVQHDWTECFRPGLFLTPIEYAARCTWPGRW